MTKGRDTSGTPSTPWGLVILLGALTAYAPMSLDLYLPSLPAIARDLPASASQAQTTVSAFLMGMGIGQLFYGPASDRFGRRGPLLIGGVIYCLASVACALSTSPEMLIGARVIQALGGCAGGVVARAVVRDRFSHAETARMLSLMLLVMGLAPILAPLLGGVLVTLGGWRLNFWVLTSFGVLVTGAVFFRLKDSRSEETLVQARSENALQAYWTLLSQRRLMGYAFGSALTGSALFTYVTASPDLVIGTYGVAPTAFGWVFGINAAGMIAGSQVNRWLLRRHLPDRILSWASLITLAMGCLLVLAAMTGWGGKWSVLGTLFVLMSTYSFTQSNAMAGALNIDQRRAGSISALMGGLQFSIGGLVSSLGSLFHDGTARPMALTMLVGIIAANVVLRTMTLRKDAGV